MRLGVIADPHLALSGTPPERWHNELDLDGSIARFRAAIDRCRTEDVDGLAILGDLSNLGDEAHLVLGAKLAAEIGTPVWIVPGNHDVLMANDAMAQAIALSGQSSVKLLSSNMDFMDEKVDLVGLPLRRVDEALEHESPPPRPATGRGERLLIVVSHFPVLDLRDRLDAGGLAYAGNLRNRSELSSYLVDRPGPVVFVHGHLHVRAAIAEGKLLHLSCAALVEAPNEVTFLDVEIGVREIVVRRSSVAIDAAAPAVLPTLSPARQTWKWSGRRWTVLAGGDPRSGAPREPRCTTSELRELGLDPGRPGRRRGRPARTGEPVGWPPPRHGTMSPCCR